MKCFRCLCFFWNSNKHGRRSKFKWPDTFLIESSGRRETPESIAEAKARDARRHNTTTVKPTETTVEYEDVTEQEIEANQEPPRGLENDTGSDQDLSEDEDFDDSSTDETSKSNINYEISYEDI